MIVFSTVIEIDGEPTLYNVYKNKSLAFLNPYGVAKALLARAPILYACCEDSEWKIKGTDNAAIMQQALKEISVAD